MDVRQLAALTAVADHGTFSAAAAALHTVQSNVSAHVARLESELGTSLFDRSAGRLPEAGEAVVGRARRVQAELDALAADVASMQAQVSGSTRIGIIGTVARWLTAPLLRAMAAQHPAVRVIVVDATFTSLAPQLENGSLELALVNLPVDDPDLATEELFREDRVLVVPSGHDLAGRATVDVAELAGVPLVLPPPGTSFRVALDLAAAAVGVTLVAAAEIDGLRLIASLAFDGHAAAIVPASALATAPVGPWHRVTLTGVPPRSVGLVRRRRALPSAPSRAVAEVLRSVLAEEATHQPAVRLTAAG